MLSILIANAKGGSGKTTVATNLAAAFATAGRRTVLADADRQGSSTLWQALRPGNVAPVGILDWSKSIGSAPKGTERLVIDSAGSVKKGMVEALLEMADMVVLPIMPSVFDHGAADAFLTRLDALKSVRKGKKEVAVVGNRVRPRTKAAARLDAYLARQGHNVLTRLRDSQLYPEAASVGLGLYDLRDTRTAQLRQDWSPLIAYLEDGVM